MAKADQVDMQLLDRSLLLAGPTGLALQPRQLTYRRMDQACSDDQEPQTSARSLPSEDIYGWYSATDPYAGQSHGSAHARANASDG